MIVKWNGVIKSIALHKDEIAIRHQLADAAKTYNWQKTLDILNKRPDLINTTRPDGYSLDTPLHQAAYGNAAPKIIKKLIAIGSWRTLKNRDGEKPIDLARRKNYSHLIQLLQPIYKRNVDRDILINIQQHFHQLIRDLANRLVIKYELRLPELEPLLEIDPNTIYFPIPGMYGGFKYWLDGERINTKLIAESWCRVVGGSGQRHEVTESGCILVDSGFI